MGFKQFRLEGIGTVPAVKGGTSISRHKDASDYHPYLRQDFWLNPSNQFWLSSLYSEESKRDLAMRANVTYTV